MFGVEKKGDGGTWLLVGDGGSLEEEREIIEARRGLGFSLFFISRRPFLSTVNQGA